MRKIDLVYLLALLVALLGTVIGMADISAAIYFGVVLLPLSVFLVALGLQIGGLFVFCLLAPFVGRR